jgi:hypothetical protein
MGSPKSVEDERHTSRLLYTRNDIIVAREVDGEVGFQARTAVVAPQAPLVLRLRPWCGPRRGNVVDGHAQGRGYAIGDAEQLAMWLCNGNLGRRSRVGRLGRESGGWPLPGHGAGFSVVAAVVVVVVVVVVVSKRE